MATRTTISSFELGPVIFGGIDGIISFYQGKGLLSPAEHLPLLFGSHEYCMGTSLTEMVMLSGAHSATHAQA